MTELLRGFGLLLAFLLANCSTETYKTIVIDTAFPDHYQKFAPEFHVYVHEFDQKASQRGRNTSAVLTSMKLVDKLTHNSKNNTAGVCYSTGGRTQLHIEIRSRHWFEFDDLQRRALIYHELGHCVLDLPHTDEKLAVGWLEIPRLMNPYISSSWFLRPYWERLVDDFFSMGEEK